MVAAKLAAVQPGRWQLIAIAVLLAVVSARFHPVACNQAEVPAQDGALEAALMGSNKPASGDKPASLPAEMERVKKLCRWDQKVAIGSIPEMLRLIALVARDDQACKQRFLSAIYELEPILKLDRGAYCDEHAFELIKNYHFRFIQPFRRANRRPTQFEPYPRDLVKKQLHPEPRKYTVEFDEHEQVLYAPIAVRHFFLKLALQVSFECKKNLLNNLLADAQRLLDAQDFEVLAMFDEQAPIGQALAAGIEQMDFDSVLYIPELDGKLKHRATGEELQPEGREQHLKTSASENSALYQMLFACKRRFKPLYDKLILPIVRLSKLGYDYQGREGFSEREQQFLTGARMKNWLVVVHVCEIFKNTHLTRATKKKSKFAEPPPVAPEDEGKLSVVSEEELRELREEAERERERELERDREEEEHQEREHADMVTSAPRRQGGASARSSGGSSSSASSSFNCFNPIEYELTVRNELPDELMIKDESRLDLELSRKHGHSDPFGFRGFLRRLSGHLKALLAKLDLERFAHYRHNSLFYSGLLNFLSACSNVASISVTISGIVATVG